MSDKNINYENFIKDLRKRDGHQGVVALKDMGQPAFYLSTGDDILDIYISNKKYSGVSSNRVTQFGGLEGCVTEDTLVKIKVK